MKLVKVTQELKLVQVNDLIDVLAVAAVVVGPSV